MVLFLDNFVCVCMCVFVQKFDKKRFLFLRNIGKYVSSLGIDCASSLPYLR